MQVSIMKKDILSAEEFFLGIKALIVRVTDEHGRTIKFKTTSEADGYGNFYIKTRGVFKGRTTATYRLPRATGNLEELYELVGDGMRHVLPKLIEKDRETISRLRRFQSEG